MPATIERALTNEDQLEEAFASYFNIGILKGRKRLDFPLGHEMWSVIDFPLSCFSAEDENLECNIFKSRFRGEGVYLEVCAVNLK